MSIKPHRVYAPSVGEGHQPSFKFLNRRLGVRVSIYADSRQGAWEVLISILNPTVLRDFSLESVEVDESKYHP